VRWIASTGRPFFKITGEPHRLMGVSADITDSKRAEEAFRINEARLAAGTDLAGLGCYEVDFDECTCFIDDRFHDICGVPAGQQQDLQSVEFWMDHLHPDDRQRVLDERQKLRDWRLDRISLEYRYMHPTGGQKWIHHMVRVAMRSATGRVLRTSGVVRDITNRKRAEESIREIQTTLNAIIDSTDDLIWSVDPNSFGLMTFNRGLREYFLQRRSIRLEPGMRPEDLFPPGEYVQRWRGFYQRALQDGPFTTEYLVYARSHVLQLSFNVLKRDGEVFGVSAFGKDITEQRRVEREANELRDNLTHLTRVNTLSVLSGSLAHELNQPLGIILSNAQAAQEMLLQEPPDVTEVKAILSDIVAADRRAGDVIERLRAMLKRGQMSLHPLPLNQVIEEVLRLINADLIGRGVTVVCDLAPHLPPIAGDRVQLQQLVLNLVLNAADAVADNAPGTRRLHLHTMFHKDRVRTSVRDEGGGLPAEVERLFQPFYTTKLHGLGMGLAICRSIITAHEGRLWAEPHPERGAVFHFELPIAGEEEEKGSGFRIQEERNE
jgi:PAS domain S-box-containing protein